MQNKHQIQKSVIYLETGEIFNSITLASKNKGINHKTIVKHCEYDKCGRLLEIKERNKPKSYQKPMWRYLDAELSEIVHDCTPKRVKCLETATIYDSMGEAERKCGVARACIRESCKTSGKLETCGLHFMFV